MSPTEQEELDCDICGEPHKCKHIHTLKCNHSFHYECIMKSYISSRDKYNQCPLCRKKQGVLPLVNGLPKLIRGIHYITEHPPSYTSIRCISLLKYGKRKGGECGSKCILGFNVCNRHHTMNMNSKAKAKAKAKPTVKAKAKPTVKAKAKPTAKPTVKAKAKPTVKAKAKPTVKAKAKPTVKAKGQSKETHALGDALEQVQVEQLIATTSNTDSLQQQITA
jgi:hypothetical protein